jgi:branched-chain amino acid transport system permease protein
MFDTNTVFGKRAELILTILACLGLVLIPILYAESYRIFQFSLVAVYAILLMGLNILTGFTGQLSIGHSSFYALGAYTGAILLPHLGPYFYLIFPIAGFIGLLAGLFFGLVALRIHGPYLAIVTLSLAVSTPSILKYFSKVTGGATGINIQRPSAPSWLPITDDRYMYLVAILLTLFIFYVTRNLIKSTKGRAFIAIRDNEIVATTMGIGVVKNKMAAFAISVMYAGIAGSMAALVIQYISPEVFSLEVSIFLIVGLIIGGIGSKWGPIYGALYVLYLPNLSEYVSKGAPVIVSGLVLILLVMFTPGGTNEIIMRSYYKLKKSFALIKN